MLRVGLTGGIATGKSTAGAMFVELGCYLINSDQITHELLRPGQPVYDAVVKEFGIGIIGADQAIDRRIFGEIVFNDPQARARLQQPGSSRCHRASKRMAERSRGSGSRRSSHRRCRSDD